MTARTAIRGDNTNDNVAEWCERDIESSKTQPNPAKPVVRFHAASVYTRHTSRGEGGGLILIKGFSGGVSIRDYFTTKNVISPICRGK